MRNFRRPLREGNRFNGATAMEPWKRLEVKLPPAFGRAGFNGATAMEPWKSHVCGPNSRD